MKQIIFWLAKYSGIFALCRWLTRKDIRILAYHGIWLGEGHFGNFLYMSSSKFASRMQKLNDMGLPVMSLDEALHRRREGTLPNCATVLTIDDGWYSTYLHMLPVLTKYDFPSTLYVTTYYSEKQVPVFDVALQYMFSRTAVKNLDLQVLGFDRVLTVDLTSDIQLEQAKITIQEHLSSLADEDARQSLMSRIGECLEIDYVDIQSKKLFHLVTPEQILEMDSQKIDIQLHTHRHRISCWGEDCLERELQDNRACLEPLLGKSLSHFCYPSGVYEDSNWQQLKKAKIRSATTTKVGFVSKESHLYALPRILDGEDVSELEFEAEISGFGELKRRLLQ